MDKNQILNLTQHDATPDQIAAGVVDVPDKKALRELLTFTEVPSKEDILERAGEIAIMASRQGASKAMIGGAPYLMSALELALKYAKIQPLYSFTKRDVIEEPQADGTLKKTAVFKHAGWITV